MKFTSYWAVIQSEARFVFGSSECVSAMMFASRAVKNS